MDILLKKVLTFDEACLYTGYKKSYMYKLTSKNIIPHSKPNRRSIFFDRERLEKWMLGESNVTSTEQDIIADNYVAGRMLATG